MSQVSVNQLMDSSGVKFGTSGARGLASQLTDLVAYSYTMAFLNQQKEAGSQFPQVALAGDLRPSTERIISAAAEAVRDFGAEPNYMGRIPSPALALFGIKNSIPTVMVTGSHIPADRNGIKYTTAKGEITKADEVQIKEQTLEIPEGKFADSGLFLSSKQLSKKDPRAEEEFEARYLDAYETDALKGLRVGVYEHSAVGRDFLVSLYKKLGAEVIELGRSEEFVPVDTEAIRAEDVELGAKWAAEHNLDSIVSTDGDSDRPLISDERGQWIRGDVSGILTAQVLGAEAVSTPVSCNSAVDKCGLFKQVIRTKIGSPFVIAGMEQASKEGFKTVGYEANGGFLLASDFGKLGALPTRDAAVSYTHLTLPTICSV